MSGNIDILTFILYLCIATIVCDGMCVEFES